MAADTDATPFQTPPSMKNAAGLSGSNEYAATWTGQSNSRPRAYPADGLSVAQELALMSTGKDVTGIVIPDLATREVGMIEVLTIATALVYQEWSTNTWLRLGSMALAVAGAPQKGYARVLENNVLTLTVQWISLPVNDQTVNGYLVKDPEPGFEAATGRPGGERYYGYQEVRVLTPYTPLKDIEAPWQGSTVWLPEKHAEYPTANAPLRAGRRLLLPAPWVVPSTVTTFDDLALFLPITRREGSHGYGISDVADASYAGTGDPTAHPITDITAGVFTFANAVSANVDLTDGYLIVDWQQSGSSKRSWARIASNTTTTFTPDSTTWLGDGVPDTPPTAAVTFDTATDEVIWTSHGLSEGDRVTFTGTTPPGGLSFGVIYTVRNVNGADRFQVSKALGRPVIDIDVGAVSVSGFVVWWYTAWIGHFRDNPNMWLPGPEFGYPNEDQQPHGTFVHWRARGQLLFVHMLEEYPATVDPTYLAKPFDESQDARFGAMLPFGYRLATALGKRINMVCLGINGAPLLPSHDQNRFTYGGRVGWFEKDRYGYGIALEDTESLLSARLKRLITVMAPAALLAEANTKPLKYLSSCHVQGETDALMDGGRELYIASITDYKRWLRDLFDSINANPYEGGAQVPFAQPMITRDPWESATAGANPDFQTFGWDTQGDTNNAIRLAHTADPFADYTITEDIPKMKFNNGTIDNAHFGGQGMAWQGARLAKVALDLIEYAFSYSSTALATTNARLLRVANLALLYIGQGARQITSLAATTAEATLVSTLLPEATRQLLSMRPWAWAIRTEPATKIKHSSTRWNFAYAVPGRAITVLAILPPKDPNTPNPLAAPLPAPIDVDIPTTEPLAFEVNRDISGNRVLYADVDEIAGDVSASSVADGVLHPERLPARPWIRYVDHALDPDDFSESFTTALTWLLASMLAPSLVKGVEGDRVAQEALLKCGGFIRAEAWHETMTRVQSVDYREQHQPSWISGR